MSTEIKVGLLVLVAFIVGAGLVVRIEGFGGLDGDSAYGVRIRFDNIAGLTEDAPVLLAGVRVGEVADINLTEDGQAEVLVRLRRDVVIHTDASASVASMGMMGDKYLELRPGSPEAERVEEGGSISGGKNISVDRMVAVFSDIAEDLQATVGSLNNVLGTSEGEATMKDILENVEAFTAELRDVIAENRNPIDQTLGNFDTTLESMRRLSEQLESSLPQMVADIRSVADQITGVVGENQENLGSTSENLLRMSERLDRSASDLEEVLSKMNSGEGSVARILNEPESVDKLNEALDSVDDALAAADTFFTRVGQAQFSFDWRTEVYGTTKDTKNYFGLRLELGQTTTDRAFIFHLVDDNIGGFTETNVTREIFDDFGNLLDRTIEKTLAREEGFSFSAELAQRFGAWQVRGGLIESEAGFGIDRYFAADRARLSVHMWDFGRDDNPHLKLLAEYSLLGRFFLAAGWDDVFREDARQFYLGAGYAFR